MLPCYLPAPATLRPNALRQEHQQKRITPKNISDNNSGFQKGRKIVEQNAE
jgi:hypothetical protein